MQKLIELILKLVPKSKMIQLLFAALFGLAAGLLGLTSQQVKDSVCGPQVIELKTAPVVEEK